MRIHCPVCSIAVDITEAHLGHKGRCVTCSTEFVIPEQPTGEFEILDHDEAPSEAPDEPAMPTAAPQAPRKPILKVPSGASRTPARYVPRKKNHIVPWFILLCLCGAGAFAYFEFFAEINKDNATATAKNDTHASASPEPVNDDTLTFDLPPPPPEGVDPAPLPEAQRARALTFLKSEQPNRRNSAYTALRELGDPYKKIYTELLGEAHAHHLKTLAEKASDFSSNNTSLNGFLSAYDEWQTRAASALKMVQTNWKSINKNNHKKQHAEMDRAFDEAVHLYDKLVKADEQANRQEIESLSKQAAILAEIATEQAWCDGGPVAILPLGELVAEAGGADGFVDTHAAITHAAATLRDRTDTARHNRNCSWADSVYREFAALLNDRRAAIGLGALRLDDALSRSCGEHCSDMLFNNYFSHASADGSNFSTRAKRSGFTGSPTGECLYKGGKSASGALEAWWYSDRHRLTLYASDPDTLGLGTAEYIWTLNTGKRDW